MTSEPHPDFLELMNAARGCDTARLAAQDWVEENGSPDLARAFDFVRSGGFTFGRRDDFVSEEKLRRLWGGAHPGVPYPAAEVGQVIFFMFPDSQPGHADPEDVFGPDTFAWFRVAHVN